MRRQVSTKARFFIKGHTSEAAGPITADDLRAAFDDMTPGARRLLGPNTTDSRTGLVCTGGMPHSSRPVFSAWKSAGA